MTKRERLAELAKREGALQLSGNEAMAGEAIEKYLSLFREAMNENGGGGLCSNKEIGYSWCCAFTYYCCLEVGYRIPPKPVASFRWTLAAVPAWFHWANLDENRYYFDREEGIEKIEPGDIVLFDRILEDCELDHIGVVVEVSEGSFLSAEGGFNNRSGLFERDKRDCVNGYIRLP